MKPPTAAGICTTIEFPRQVLDGIPLSKAEQQQADEKFSGKAWRWITMVAMGALVKPMVSSMADDLMWVWVNTY